MDHSLKNEIRIGFNLIAQSNVSHKERDAAQDKPMGSYFFPPQLFPFILSISIPKVRGKYEICTITPNW